MILLWLVLIPLIAGMLAAIVARWNAPLTRWISLCAISINLLLSVSLWMRHSRLGMIPMGQWAEQFDVPWMPTFGIRFHLAADGLSLLMLVLTAFLGVMAVLASWSEIQNRTGFYYFNLMWILSGITGVFLSVDLFLFYLFWELMLIPMYFLIAIWGHERRIYAAVKFFLFTQFSGLLMLVAIVSLYFVHAGSTGIATFDYSALLGTSIGANTARWLFLGFVVAFVVKLPAVPLHTWLPDAHTEAPTAGSVILAGLLLKTGAYGLIRFAVPLFPGAAAEFSRPLMILGAAGILYGAILAFGQTDLKRMVAYTSVSHMGFVLVGIFALNTIALKGAILQMICHGISTGGLFVVVGMIYERAHTRSLTQLSGLWKTAPALSGVAMVFAMASLGLPGLGDFVGEILILFGSYRANVGVTVAATIGVLAATLYGLALAQKAFQGPNEHNWSFPDLSVRERLTAAMMIAALVWIGFYPQPLLRTFAPAQTTTQASISR